MGSSAINSTVKNKHTCITPTLLACTLLVCMFVSAPLLSEGKGWLVIADISIFGEESEQVFEGLLSHTDTVGPVPHGTCTPEKHTHTHISGLFVHSSTQKSGTPHRVIQHMYESQLLRYEQPLAYIHVENAKESGSMHIHACTHM